MFDDFSTYLYFRCNGKSACKAFANATHFPNDIDPCPSTVKYLEAQFYCMKMKITQPPPSPTSEVFNVTGMYYSVKKKKLNSSNSSHFCYTVLDLVFLSYKILLRQHDNGKIFVATMMTITTKRQKKSSQIPIRLV